MSWETVLLDEKDSSPKHLRGRIDDLLEHQRKHWNQFREGETSLGAMRTKQFTRTGARVIVQSNPGRSTSVHAKVDPASVSQRPCFLCPENIPPEEKGIAFGDLVILPNPHPILPRHLTAPTRDHLPQKLEGRVETFVNLTAAIGPDMLVLYNGARCGASAPDHFHFQACSTVGVPLLEELTETTVTDEITPVTSFGRRILVFKSSGVRRTVALIETSLEALDSFGNDDEEPLFNMISVHRSEFFMVYFFPRAKHRPDCYFADDGSRLSISPGSLEMAGIVVVADPDHYERVDAATTLTIFEEVTLEQERFNALAAVVK
jgi:hypothetical protein